MSQKWSKEHPSRNIWVGIRQRCLNPNNHAYHYYGGRGITVCEEWLDFKNFDKDMGPRPSSDYSIDRIDNNKGYYKENCRWATRLEQGRNRRNLIKIEDKYLWEICQEMGISYQRAYKASRNNVPLDKVQQRTDIVQRYAEMKIAANLLGLSVCAIGFRLKSGWSWEKATTTPRIKMDVSNEGRARVKRINEAAKRLNMTSSAIRGRLAKGWSETEAFTTPQTQFKST